jgi:predicted porin
MKITLIALAVLGVGAAAAPAFAQTSVTIYGSFDGGMRWQNNQNANGNSRLTMSSTGTYYSNRLGFKGVEDLGGGLNAHFVLENGFNTGTGALADPNRLFNRSAFVGLGGDWGTLDLGRQYTVQFKTVGAYDPFNFKYSGIIPASGASATAGRAFDNDIQYTGIFGSLTFRAEWALGEQAGSARSNSAQSIGANYMSGPISVGAAYTLRKPSVLGNGFAAAPTATGANFQDNRDWTAGGAYVAGPLRIAAGYASETQHTTNSVSAQQKNAWIGGSYDISQAMILTAAYYDTNIENAAPTATGGRISGKRQLAIVGLTYALSKRTNLYADIDYAHFKDGLANRTVALAGGALLPLSGTGTHQTGVSVGINHLF